MTTREEQKLSVDEISKLVASYEIRQKRSTYLALISVLLPLLLGIVWISYSYSKVQALNKEYSDLQGKIKAAKIEYLEAKGLNLRKNPAGYEQSIRADEELKKLLGGNHVSNDIVIQYYRKTLDQDKVWVSIKELGYTKFDDKKSRDFFKDTETNCIYYGSRVSLFDIKAISLTLIRAGFSIRKISPFRNDTGKEDVVQIIGLKYSDGTPYDKPPFTVADIRKASDLASLNKADR